MTTPWTWSFSFRGRSKIGPTCPDCQTIHGADAAIAVGRFDPRGVRGYRSRVGGPVRATRAEAIADTCKATQQSGR